MLSIAERDMKFTLRTVEKIDVTLAKRLSFKILSANVCKLYLDQPRLELPVSYVTYQQIQKR